MPLTYSKMFKLLKANGYNSTRIRKENLLGQRTLTAIKDGTGGIDHRTIEKLCGLFDCQPNDLMEYISDDEADTMMVVRVVSEELLANHIHSLERIDSMEARVRHIFDNEPSIREHLQSVILPIILSEGKVRPLRNLKREEREVISDLVGDFAHDHFPPKSVMRLLEDRAKK